MKDVKVFCKVRLVYEGDVPGDDPALAINKLRQSMVESARENGFVPLTSATADVLEQEVDE